MNGTKYNIELAPNSDDVYQFTCDGMVIVVGTQHECRLELQLALQLNVTKYNIQRAPNSDDVYQFICEGMVIVEGTLHECRLELQLALHYELSQLGVLTNN